MFCISPGVFKHIIKQNIRTKGIIPSVYEVNQTLFKTTRNTFENKDYNVVMHFS